MRTIIFAAVFVSCAARLCAQTTIDIGRQAKNVDFSSAVFTKTFKTGTSLPATCSQAETYLKLDAPAGSNIYICTSSNVWIAQGGGTTTSKTSMSFEWTRQTSTQAHISSGSFRFGQ